MVEKLPSCAVLQNEDNVEPGFKREMKWRDKLIVHFRHNVALILDNNLLINDSEFSYFLLVFDDEFLIN